MLFIKMCFTQFHSDWTVCQISVITSPAQEKGDMYITQLQNPDSFAHLPSFPAASTRSHGDEAAATDVGGSTTDQPHADVTSPCTVVAQRLPGYATSHGQKLLVDFQEIMDGSRISMNIKNSAVEWWTKRRHLDERLKVSSVTSIRYS